MGHWPGVSGMSPVNTLWRGVPELLERMATADSGEQRPIDAFFQQRRRLGRRERGLIADAVYGCLRHLRSLDHALGDQAGDPRARLAAWLVSYADWPIEQAVSAIGSDEALTGTLSRLGDPANAPPAVQAELPDWLYDELCRQLPAAEVLDLGLALQQNAPLDLRVNTLRGKPAKALTALANEDMPLSPCPWSPIGLRHAAHHPGHLPVQRSKAYTQGWVEVQDEGSQLVAPLLEPRRGETVIDLCAGAGGKTLHLAALMANQGNIHAFDPSGRRLKELEQRCQRAGVDNTVATRIEDEQAAAIRRFYGKADRVLIDAPCSGTGTLRRHPEIRWQRHDLAVLTATQDRLLDVGARLLRPGGRLVYATCSLLAQENEQRIEAFAERHPDLRLLPPAPILKRRKIALDIADEATSLRLYPHRHGTDGFFAAVFEKVTH